jgi:hypothetical protein
MTLSLSANEAIQTTLSSIKHDTLVINGTPLDIEITQKTITNLSSGQKEVFYILEKIYRRSKNIVTIGYEYDLKTEVTGDVLYKQAKSTEYPETILNFEEDKPFSPVWIAEHGDKPRPCVSPYFFGKEKKD